MRSGSLNIPPQVSRSSGAMGAMPAARFEGPRSPPSESLFPSRIFSPPRTFRRRISLHGVPTARVSQEPATFVLTQVSLFLELDTSHVPCKFFRQGACQAGNACPFSHDLGSAAETVCKYFAKVCDPESSPQLYLPYDTCVRLPTLAEGPLNTILTSSSHAT
jgi:cleavage and polyadenylation specificity factor subunit 4